MRENIYRIINFRLNFRKFNEINNFGKGITSGIQNSASIHQSGYMSIGYPENTFIHKGSEMFHSADV